MDTSPHKPDGAANVTSKESSQDNISNGLGEQSSAIKTVVKLSIASILLYSSYRSSHMYHDKGNITRRQQDDSLTMQSRRRLSVVSSVSTVPTYMDGLMDDLAAREKLFDETPPEEVKYWFEYTGPLQKYYYRYSKERQKADAFEGRDDSGVLSSRFSPTGGGTAYRSFYNISNASPSFTGEFSESSIPTSELPSRFRLLDNCFALGNPTRPNLNKNSPWHAWFSPSSSSSSPVSDRCRVLVTLNTVGAGRRSTLLWETNPPKPAHAAGPTPWISEQETAAQHLERNLKEMDEMCKTRLIAVRLQVLVCEPIPGVWTDWMDSLLPNCGGKVGPLAESVKEEDRPSPLQVVVVASSATADTCHDLKSGFMEKRMQDLILAPPYLTSKEKQNEKKSAPVDPTIKTTHPDLVSSDDHDLYIAMKWSSLITLRSVASFLQASADLSAAASSPRNQTPPKPETTPDDQIISLKGPSSPFLIPSFVRASYVSEENSKVAKWRMHGDFFHPAAWEICKDSYDVVWIPDSLSGNGGVNAVCKEGSDSIERKRLGDDEDCGQWWIYMEEEQMSTNPEVHANEIISPLVQGGSNFVWMLMERHRREIVTQKVCEHNKKDDSKMNCGPLPQAVLPLGDQESFLINFMPNTALGKKHLPGRNPGYSNQKQREKDRELVKERKQLKGQEDIEKALFDYTVYPAALMRKDATLKAARGRDSVLSTEEERKKEGGVGPLVVKSEYYDVTITKPRQPVLGWCMMIARSGLCVLYAEYFRESSDGRCAEACGMKKNWSQIDEKVIP